ncbi:hypothetical protein Acr_00g0021660 [Actinidia rufa]|uniref:Uncharacterized protein n=1 Tax=Actinidia rufa TaxID=165716 RepID=A0A7J0DCD4_9ERIC|nr:hypothetical protein Acr_00g0021660 [Actinidia rufa]
MALKSTKLEKDSLALVVSTPTTTRGQKIKSKDDPKTDKGKKKKKGKSSSVLVLEQNYLYFTEDKAQESAEIEEEDSSATELDGPFPTQLRITGHEYTLRQRGAKKFSNTIETPLVLTPSPPVSSLPALSPHATTPRTSPPPAT